MATAKNSDRKLNLDLRSAQVTSLNLTTENHGKDNRVPRVDVSVGFLVEDADMPEVLDVKGSALETLWHNDGSPMLRELKGAIVLDTKVSGVAVLGLNNEHTVEFDKAVLKAVKLTPLQKFQAEVTCQVRVDPGDDIALLEDILVASKGVFSFTGEAEKPEDKSQQNLPV